MADRELPAGLVFLCGCLSSKADLTGLPAPPSPRLLNSASDIACRTLLAPAFHCALMRNGISGEAPALLRELLETLYALNKKRTEALLGQLIFTIGALNGRGIIPVALKGAAVIAENRPTEGAERVMVDLDLLVPPESLLEGVKALREAGYEKLQEYKWNPAIHHHYPRLVHPDWPSSIELHQRALSVKLGGIFPVEEVWRDLRPLGALPPDLHALALSPTNEVFHSFAHSFHHSNNSRENLPFPKLGLRQLYNYSLLCEFHGEAIDWERIERLSRDDIFRNHLATYHYFAARLFGAQLPFRVADPDREEKKLLKTLWSVLGNETDTAVRLRNAANRLHLVYSREKIMEKFPGDTRIQRLRFLETMRLLKKHGVRNAVQKTLGIGG